METARSNCWFYLIFITAVIRLSRSHPDCNHKKVVDQFFYMCNSYSGSYSSIKRETNSANGFRPPSPSVYGPPPGWNNNEQQFQQQQIPPQKETPQQPVQPPEPVPTPSNSYYTLQEPYYNANSPREGSSVASGPMSVQRHSPPPHRERLHLATDPVNEPEDFTSFNDYYLNPVYADADWQSSIERWRRNPQIKQEILRFVRTKCCESGCTFPDDYWELDKRVNICGMR